MAASKARSPHWKARFEIEEKKSFRNSLRFLRALALVGWNRTSATAWRWRGGCAENQKVTEPRTVVSGTRTQLKQEVSP